MKRNQAPIFLSGREFSAQEIQDIQETGRAFGRLSWAELVQTLCESLRWVRLAGRYKVDSGAKPLVKLKALGWVKLPLRRAGQRSRAEIHLAEGTDPEEEIVGTGREVAPVEVEPGGGKQGIQRWNEDVHGYQRPFGAHPRLYLLSGGEGGVAWEVYDSPPRRGRCGSGIAGWDGGSETGRND